MAASFETVDKIYMVLRRHLSCKVINEIIIDLVTIPGNKSFRETVERLNQLHQSHRRKVMAKVEE